MDAQEQPRGAIGLCHLLIDEDIDFRVQPGIPKLLHGRPHDITWQRKLLAVIESALADDGLSIAGMVAYNGNSKDRIMTLDGAIVPGNCANAIPDNVNKMRAANK